MELHALIRRYQLKINSSPSHVVSHLISLYKMLTEVFVAHVYELSDDFRPAMTEIFITVKISCKLFVESYYLWEVSILSSLCH